MSKALRKRLQSTLKPSMRRVGARRPPARATLAFEGLEDRVTPAVVTLGPLQFEGDFAFNSAASTYTLTSGPAQLGLTPTTGESFKPLLQLDGSVFFSDAGNNPTSTFTVSGDVDVATVSPQIHLWTGLSNVTIAAADLLTSSTGVELDSGGQPVTIDNGSATFTPDNVRFFDPDAVSGTSDAVIRLQGGVTIADTDPELTGLAGTVSGSSQFVVVDPAPPLGTVPGVQQMTATLKSSFSLAGVEFGGATFTAKYSRTDSPGVIIGGQSITFGLEGVDVKVNLKGNGIVVKDGTFATFQLGVAESFNLLGLKIDVGTSSNPLTIDFEPGLGGKSSLFAMSGDLKVSTAQQAVSSVSNKVFDSVAASFVANPNTGKAGLEIINGEVDTLDLTITGDIDLFGLKVSAEGLNIDYIQDQNDLILTGGISVEELFKATATIGASGSTGGIHINTSTGAVTVDDLALALTDVNLGVFKIDDLEVAYSVDPSTLVTHFDVTLMMSFPENWRVSGEIAFADDKLQEISLAWDASKQGRIPIGDTGLFLIGMDATVQNIDQPRDLTVSGEIAVEFGTDVTIFGQNCTVFRAVGGFSANEDELTLGADVWLGAFTDGNGNTTGVLGTGSGEVDLDWNDQVYSADVHASLLDGTFTYDAKFNFDNGGDIWIAVDASVNVPHSVPLIGGTHLASMDFRFSYQKDHPENSYVAAWTDINLVVTSVDIGFEYTFDTKSVKVIGSHDVKKLRNPPTNDQASVYSYTQEYDVPLGATSANLSVDFAPNSGSQTISVSTDGGQTFISENDPKFAQLGFTKLTQLDTATSRNISIVDPGNKDNPPSVLLKPSGGSYILKLTSTNYQFPPTSAKIDSITDDGHGNTLIHFSQPPGDLKVGDFFTVQGSDVSGYNVEHAVNAILDSQTVVTDQPYTADSHVEATASGWDSPHFTATFYNPPPTIGVISPADPRTNTLQVNVNATVDSAFANTTTVDLYLDTDSSGYDGKLIARNVPLKPGPDGKYNDVPILATLGNLLPLKYYIYAVINDGTNTPVFSAYSDSFTTDYAVQGTVHLPNMPDNPDLSQQPQDGWTVFFDVNGNGRLDPNEPASAPTSNGGFYAIPGWINQNIASITRDASGKALVTFTSPLPAWLLSGGLPPGQYITVMNSNTDYDGKQSIVAVSGTSSVVIGHAFTTGISGSATAEVPQVPIDTPFKIVLINPLPDYFDFDGGNTEVLTYDGNNPGNGDFTVQEKSAIQGTVFNDLNSTGQRAGQPGLAGWLVFLDQNQNGRLDPGEAYTTTQSDGSYNFAPFTPQQAGTYHVVVAPPTGAAALYTFEDVNGTYVYDASNSPNVHGGTLVNGAQVGTAATFGIDPRPGSGPSNDVLKLDGNSQFVQVPHHDDLEPGTGAFSAGAWVRFTTGTNFKQMIAGSQSPQSPFEGWSLLVSFNDFSRSGAGDRKLYLDLRQVGTGASVGISGKTTLEDNQWYYVAFTYDPTDPTAPIKLYVNGVLDGSGGAGALPSPDISTTDQVSFDLGNQGGSSPAFPMGGFLDDVSVWDSALSPLQVLALSSGGMTPSYYQTNYLQGHTVTLDNSGHDVRQTDDSGNRNDFGAKAFATISGTVQGNLLNSGGKLDPSTPLVGWTVQLLQDGKVVATTTSRTDGSYIFTNLLPGSYTIQQTVPEGWRQTSPFTSDAQFQPTSLNTSGLGHWVTVGDFDGDGHLDLAIPSVQSKEVAVLFGKGDGTFSAPVEYAISFANAAQIRTADLNGDGRPDIAVVSPDGVVDVLFNQGGTDRAALLSPKSAVWQLGASPVFDMVAGDFNHDGMDELAVLYIPTGQSSTSERIALLRLDAATVLVTSPVVSSRALAVGDMDNDGNLDLVTSGSTAQFTLGAAIFYGDGKGSFKNINVINDLPISYSPAAVGDLNGDGRLDLVLSTTGAFLYAPQTASGTFASNVGIYLKPPTPILPVDSDTLMSSGSVAVADVDGDLKPDLVVLPLSSHVVNVYANQGSASGGTLQSPPSLVTLSDTSYWTLVSADVNGDGLNDIVVMDSNSSTGASFVLLNKSPVNQSLAIAVATGQDATVNFTSSQLAPTSVTPSAQITGVVYDDANGDGRREAGDVPREGAVVYLDLNRNGKLDPSEPSMTTLAGGAYRFGGPEGSSAHLPDGTYLVRIADETGRIRTSGRQGYEVRLVDGVPDSSGPRSFDFGTALNQSPVVTGVTISGPVVEGRTMALAATFVDRDSLGADTVLVSWGDGTTSFGLVTEAGGTGTVSASHVYASGGFYEIVVSVIDGSDPTVRGTAAPVTATVIGAGVHDGVLRILGTDGPDKVVISNQGAAGLQVTATFLPNGSQTFDASGIGSIEVFLYGGDDRAQIGPGVGQQVLVDGGDGDDWLKGGTGPTILRGGNGNDTLIAGTGPAVLLGGAGDDHLTGGPGRDILIGGQGADVLEGRARDDLLIGGSTRYDDALDSLMALWDEWKSGRDFATRVANILGEGSGPRANADVFLTGSGPDATVVDDGARDVLKGGPGRDVFFVTVAGAARDKVVDASGQDIRRIIQVGRRPMLRHFPRRVLARLAHWQHVRQLPHHQPLTHHQPHSR